MCALAAKSETAYHRRYRELVPRADIVFHDSPFMVDYDEQLGKDGKPRVYNSYNVEANLMQQMLEGAAQGAVCIADRRARSAAGGREQARIRDVERRARDVRGTLRLRFGQAGGGAQWLRAPADEVPADERAPDREIDAWPADDTRPLAIFSAAAIRRTSRLHASFARSLPRLCLGFVSASQARCAIG